MKRLNRKQLSRKQPKAPLACSHSSENNPCKIVQNGGRNRKPKTLDLTGSLSPVRVQRYYCKTHHVSMTWVPPELLPHIHYKAPIVNAYVWRYVDGDRHPASSEIFDKPHPKTVKRWIRRFTRNLAQLPKKIYAAMGIQKTEKDNQGPFNRNTYTVKLLQTWGLLKLLSQAMPERRVPYHYAYGFSRSP